MIILGVILGLTFFVSMDNYIENTFLNDVNNMHEQYDYCKRFDLTEYDNISVDSKDTLIIFLDESTLLINSDFKYYSNKSDSLFTYLRLLNSEKIIYTNNIDDVEFSTLHTAAHYTNEEANGYVSCEYTPYFQTASLKRSLNKSDMYLLGALMFLLVGISNYFYININRKKITIYLLNGVSNVKILNEVIKHNILYTSIGLGISYLITRLVYLNVEVKVIHLYDMIATFILFIVTGVFIALFTFIFYKLIFGQKWIYFLKDFNRIKFNHILMYTIIVLCTVVILNLVNVYTTLDAYNNLGSNSEAEYLENNYYEVRTVEDDAYNSLEFEHSKCQRQYFFIASDKNGDDITICTISTNIFNETNQTNLNEDDVYIFGRNVNSNSDVVDEILNSQFLIASNIKASDIVYSDKYVNYHSTHGYYYDNTYILVAGSKYFENSMKLMLQQGNILYGFYVKKSDDINDTITIGEVTTHSGIDSSNMSLFLMSSSLQYFILILILVLMEFTFKTIIVHDLKSKVRALYYFSNKKWFFIYNDILIVSLVILFGIIYCLFNPNIDFYILLASIIVIKVISYFKVNRLIREKMLNERREHVRSK